MHTKSDNRFYELLARRQAGELTLEERIELNNIIQSREGFADIAGLMEGVMQASYTESTEVNTEFLENRWQAVKQKINKNPAAPKKTFRAWYWAAAACLAALGAFIFIQNNNKPVPEKNNIVYSKKGSKTKVTLPDGSTVMLNGDSKITYNEAFGIRLREVALSGEAYFEVVKNKQVPFIVHTGNMDVKVLGTIFNVKAYPDDKTTETSLIKGSVEVALKNNPDKKIILKPSEKISVQNHYFEKHINISREAAGPQIALSTITPVQHDTVAMEMQWMQNKLVFQNKKLEDIAADLSRWYGTAIIITDEKIKSKTYSGIFEDETIEQVLDALKLAGGFHFKNENKTITIYP